MNGAISVEFRSMRAGTCGFCRKEKEQVYDVVFSDNSFAGQICRGDLLKIIGFKVDVHPSASGSKPATNGVPVGST